MYLITDMTHWLLWADKIYLTLELILLKRTESFTTKIFAQESFFVQEKFDYWFVHTVPGENNGGGNATYYFERRDQHFASIFLPSRGQIEII
jgi:hypothetical protein